MGTRLDEDNTAGKTSEADLYRLQKYRDSSEECIPPRMFVPKTATQGKLGYGDECKYDCTKDRCCVTASCAVNNGRITMTHNAEITAWAEEDCDEGYTRKYDNESETKQIKD